MHRLLPAIAALILVAGCGSQPQAQNAPTPQLDVAAIEQNLRANFGGTMWFSSVKSLEATGSNRLAVNTEIFPDAEGKQFAEDICRKMLANTAQAGVKVVNVRGQDGKVLAHCAR